MNCSCNSWDVSAMEPIYYTNNTGMTMKIYFISGLCEGRIDGFSDVCARAVVPAGHSIDYALPSGAMSWICQVDEHERVSCTIALSGHRWTSDTLYRYI